MEKQLANKASTSALKAPKKSRQGHIKKVWYRDWQLYALCIPALLYVAVFCYGPMYGLQLAFKSFNGLKGIFGSEWVGMDNFTRFFESPQFWTLIKNTLVLSIYSLIAAFPIPIILSLLLNQSGNKKFRTVVQTVIYAPYFISVVVLCGMILVFFSLNTGIVNTFRDAFGLDKIFFMSKDAYFPHIYVWTGVWQSAGWGTIVYIASLGSISPDQYEAARIDGAGKWRMMLNIDLPNLMPTIITMFILNMGNFFSIGFQKAFLLQNPMNLGASEIISTYVYKVGLISAQFDYATAIGLFNNIINVFLILSANFICKKISKTSLW